MAAVLELKLTLADIKPPIWRRLLVPDQITLRRLHEFIQAVAEWNDDHLHEFIIADKRYGQPAPREVVPVRNEALVRLHTLPLAEGTSFTYVYDFGDHWQIEVRVERVLVGSPGGSYPFLLGGARAFPPEDSGGVSGYERLLAALTDPTAPEHEEYRRWAGDDFDPERFDLAAANKRLRLLTADLS